MQLICQSRSQDSGKRFTSYCQFITEGIERYDYTALHEEIHKQSIGASVPGELSLCHRPANGRVLVHQTGSTHQISLPSSSSQAHTQSSSLPTGWKVGLKIATLQLLGLSGDQSHPEPSQGPYLPCQHELLWTWKGNP